MPHSILRTLLYNEITEAYDQVDSILSRHAVSDDELFDHLTKAKDHLFQARILTDPNNNEL